MLGSIGAVMESSDIQRRSYNQAMKEAGLNWHWDIATYSELLEQSGGKDRLAHLAAATNLELSAERIDWIHARKTEIAGQTMVAEGAKLRAGVAPLIAFAKQHGLRTAFITTTYQPNIDAVFAAAGNALLQSDFDYIGSRVSVAKGKPSPDAYLAALQALGISADAAIAIEDTALSVMSAKRAGITTIATPGQFTAAQDFWQADLVINALGIADGLNPELLKYITLN